MLKLPKNYYKYAELNLNELEKDVENDKISVSFTTYIACKIEKHCLSENKSVTNFIKEILIDSDLLDESDLIMRDRSKHKSEFMNKNCNNFKGLKSFKVYHIRISEYAKAKLIKKLIELETDLTWFLKSRMVKREVSSKDYQILQLEDLSY
ncbi:hypothetical protein [Hydrogenimonas thermophila]|uniref:Uncharacterized protein n=1 Tax=Hydrogenimonas thermophila TaxID=223786 RepID=A0A1I5UM33_9BACT|nr:hypothetical protein [Hydrogenimonas thermophila]SFP96290.1 hypothetical protein SAMN05216234_1659 [Hydrogenimonas thermophila]